MLEHSDPGKTKYSLNDSGEFIIADYNSTKPFSSFLPGIAGVDGIPMWVFYVNRGQCICSMGIRDKDHAIMEFQPANQAYSLVNSHGFRTFLKLTGDSPIGYYEPFQNHYRDLHLERSQRMIISPHHLTLEEVNESLNLKFTVEYFTVPKDDYAGLVRVLHIDNLGSKSVTMEGLDGLPVIVPHGVDNHSLKNMRRTIEAFVEVGNLDNAAPFFKAKVQTADRPDVMRITRGNFYVGFEIIGANTNRVAPIVDPNRIFGTQTDYSFPERFLALSADEIIRNQKLEGQLPCAAGVFTTTIPAKDRYTYYSVIGHAPSVNKLNDMVNRIATSEYVEARSQMNRDVIERLTRNNLICSEEPVLDHYVRMNFLDNTMRGGFPVTIAGKEHQTTIHLYSRKHGDLERDYNDFRLMPTHYSQGNGNFRDINQNRRSDLLFNPDVKEDNIEYFYNLIQLDGFNPLVLKERRFEAKDRKRVNGVLMKFVPAEDLETVESYLNESFTPGALLAFLKEHTRTPIADTHMFLGELLDHCFSVSDTEHGEGFWTDHWTYNLDLLENYIAVYPDKFQDLLFGNDRFTFYNNRYRVQPRDEKYVLWEGQPMQLGAVVFDEEKAATMEQFDRHRNQVRAAFGKGAVYHTSLFTKLLCLIVNKMASLDPEGVGVEMEAGKPSWYDALNGLPGLFGSSVSETLEIKRHITFLLEQLPEYESSHDEVLLFEELNEFMGTLQALLANDLSSFKFWDAASTASERYREQTRLGIRGREVRVKLSSVRDFFAAALKRLEQGIEKAWDPESKTLYTYFRHEVLDYQIVGTSGSVGAKKAKDNDNQCRHIRPSKFRQIPLPLFLEGPVHYLRCRPDVETARKFAGDIKRSKLFDNSLKMYKVNASLIDQPMAIGRARVFSPGWLENESIWLHMEYKYLLELLRNELYTEFYEDFKNVCIPFLSPDVYGRSVLENSSFIASSAHPDRSIHGNGYVARLSGATAEFIHMMLLMAVGPRPFRLNSEGELQLCLNPSLPSWLFTRESRSVKLVRDDVWQDVELPAGSFSFMFLGKILITYHNSALKNTFGDSSVKPVEWKVVDLHERTRTFDTETVSGGVAIDIRERRISRIDIQLR